MNRSTRGKNGSSIASPNCIAQPGVDRMFYNFIPLCVCVCVCVCVHACVRACVHVCVHSFNFVATESKLVSKEMKWTLCCDVVCGRERK